MVHGINVKFLLDTGSSVTIIHPQIWEQLPLDVRQSLRPCTQSIVAAEGSSLQVMGCTEMVVRFGKLHRRHLILVAPIMQAGILGMDFLVSHGGVLDISRYKLKFDTQEIPIFSESIPFTCCRVSVAETVTLPAGREIVIPGELRLRNGCTSRGIIEPTGRFTSKDEGVLLGRTLRVFNLQPEASVLYKGTQIAILQPAEEVIDETTETDDDTNLSPALRELHECSSQNLNKVQKDKLKELLCQHSNTFSESGELGRTNLVFHNIDTGNARPRRQPARRLPHHQRPEAQTQVEDMLHAGVISPSSTSSPWASPIVLVKKKDCATRFCVDYRKLK